MSVILPQPPNSSENNSEVSEKVILPPKPNGQVKDSDESSNQNIEEQRVTPPPPPPPPSDLTSILGTYREDSSNTNITILQINNKIYVSYKSWQAFPITETTPLTYVGQRPGIKITITFIKTGATVTGANATVTFSDGTPLNFNLIKISQGTPRVEEETEDYKCVSKFLRNNGYGRLSSSAGGGFKFIDISQKKNGENTQYVFYLNNTVKWRGARTLDIFDTGKWECGEDGESFKIIWSDGTVEDYGTRKVSRGGGGQSGGGGQQPNPPSVTECTKTLPCPKWNDVKVGKKTYKKCMKCPEIKKIQEAPGFKTLYFSNLRNLGKPEVTDDFFGPAMELAVREYQSSSSITNTGQIGKKTLSVIEKDIQLGKERMNQQNQNPEIEQPKVEQPKVEQPKVEQQPTQFATRQFKF